jgi:hypothetical protein
MTADSTPIPFSGRAIFRDGTLRVEGQARYPNDFSTATLEPLPGAPSDSSTLRAYSLAFHRDKEPFCGPDLIGPVVFQSGGRSGAGGNCPRVCDTGMVRGHPRRAMSQLTRYFEPLPA